MFLGEKIAKTKDEIEEKTFFFRAITMILRGKSEFYFSFY